MIKIPIYKISIIDSEITEVAITDNPAIEELALFFNKEELIDIYFEDDKQIIYGPVLIPNKLISRKDRFVYYDEDGIKKSIELFNKNGNIFNKKHTDEKVQTEILESFLTEENNDLNLPAGSWVIKAKILDKEYFNKIKNKDYGFSFQGRFLNELVGFENYNFKKEEENNMTLKEKIIEAINSILFDDDKKETVDNFVEEPIVEEGKVEEPVVEEGKENDVYVTKEEVITLITETIDEIKMILKNEILSEVENKINEITGKVGEIDTKVEEFGKQKLSQPIEAILNTINDNKSEFGYLNGLNKNKK